MYDWSPESLPKTLYHYVLTHTSMFSMERYIFLSFGWNIKQAQALVYCVLLPSYN